MQISEVDNGDTEQGAMRHNKRKSTSTASRNITRKHYRYANSQITGVTVCWVQMIEKGKERRDVLRTSKRTRTLASGETGAMGNKKRMQAECMDEGVVVHSMNGILHT